MKGVFFILLLLSVTFHANAKASKKPAKAPQVCRLTEGGWIDNEAKALAIQRGDEVIGTAHHLEDALTTLQDLKKKGRCVSAQQDCKLAGEGVVAGSWEPHRVLVDGQAVAGARDIGTVMTKLTALQDSGTCTF